jgi:hypothetical protein
MVRSDLATAVDEPVRGDAPGGSICFEPPPLCPNRQTQTDERTPRNDTNNACSGRLARRQTSEDNPQGFAINTNTHTHTHTPSPFTVPAHTHYMYARWDRFNYDELHTNQFGSVDLIL